MEFLDKQEPDSTMTKVQYKCAKNVNHINGCYDQNLFIKLLYFNRIAAQK